ncbi:MAG: ATP-dependent DNA helicase RecG [bacterium ADurb.Bin400]|nr:MAG: ATP-dependent DNA helicase RecG [bacterium ADurb.Bin400]
MAPTEVLATQHYESFQKLFGRFPKVSIGLLTANFKRVNNLGGPDAEKKLDKDRVLGAQIVIGTHALLQKNVEFEDLSLVIVDEQHRFGVAQRAALTGLMGSSSDKDLHKPHFLSMTATPIPRTLHLALFGDLDLSLIQEKPKNRKEIKTRYVEPHNRDKAYEFIRKQIQAGRQVFVICPLIEEKEDEDKVVTDLFGLDKKSVVKEYERLSKEIFPEFRVAMLHGKMKPKEKDEILVDYYAGKYHILVSTSVIEVANASVMMIEDAERFGLAQIHQFRGRVGRGEHQSFCFLFSNTRSPLALRRLNSLESVADGFRLAEIDLETRGPGDMFGTLQSGQIELKMASFSDRILIEKASEAAARVIEEDRTLSQYSSLKQRFEVFEASKHFE